MIYPSASALPVPSRCNTESNRAVSKRKSPQLGLELFCCSFHCFFCADAAALLPKRNLDVLLSAPVFLEWYEDPANNVLQRPQMPIVAEPRKTRNASDPTDLVLYDKNAVRENASESGCSSGCPMLLFFRVTACSGDEGMLNTRANAIVTSRMPMCSVKKDSRGVRVVRRSTPPVSARKRRNCGNAIKGMAARNNNTLEKYAQNVTTWSSASFEMSGPLVGGPSAGLASEG